MPTTKKQPFDVHEIDFEVLIAAPPSRVWRALVVETSSWWHDAFYTGKDPKAMHLEAKLGGRMWEDWGDGQGLSWGSVIGMRRNEFLQVDGVIDAQFGGPAHALHTWRLASQGKGTLLRFQEALWGAVGESTRKSLDEGWRFLFERCLKTWIETGNPCTDPAPGG